MSERTTSQVPPRLRAFAKEQRSTMTRAEAVFWEQVRAGRLNGHKFKRQIPVVPYVVDFVCASARLIVELDGAPHDDPRRRERDAERDAWLTGQGFRVLRLPNDLVLASLPLAMERVKAALREHPAPSPAPLWGAPSPAKGGGFS